MLILCQSKSIYCACNQLKWFLREWKLIEIVLADALNAYDYDRTLATAGIFATFPGSMNNATGGQIPEFLSSGNGIGDQVSVKIQQKNFLNNNKLFLYVEILYGLSKLSNASQYLCSDE